MNLSWGFDDDGLKASGYTGLIGDVWKGELSFLINKCIGIGLLVSQTIPAGLARSKAAKYVTDIISLSCLPEMVLSTR